MILFIDNYDSFVFNLDRYIQRLGHVTRVVRNDAISIREIEADEPEAIILSPGPCSPQEAGCSLEVVRHFYQRIPILGICLGHQTIVQALGGRVIRSTEPMHGRTSDIVHHQQSVFAGLASPLRVARYHSLIVESPLPEDLQVTATTLDGTIMACQHSTYPVVGLQFHPESILTDRGYE